MEVSWKIVDRPFTSRYSINPIPTLVAKLLETLKKDPYKVEGVLLLKDRIT